MSNAFFPLVDVEAETNASRRQLPIYRRNWINAAVRRRRNPASVVLGSGPPLADSIRGTGTPNA
jgi:hypothetical protein